MKNRVDIQALRGLAVLLVVLHHAGINGLSAGYLGVDIFFVISGFLITGLVKTGITQRDFSLSTFYFRRAKRLLPAAYVTFLVTALIAPFVLGSSELNDFAIQMVGAVTFTGNIVLWQQTGYFEGAGELKPLLHVWSLAIEEQYYFILPVTMMVVSPRRWLPFAAIVLFGSLALWVIGGHLKPIATFYLLPTRAWELAIGSIGALIAGNHRLYQLAHFLFIPALLALFAVPIFSPRGDQPGWDAVVVCVATLFVILRNHWLLNLSAPARALAHVGNFSYSLYLVHWPIFAFANNAWAGDPPGQLPIVARFIAVTLSLALGYALYRYVEVPVRKASFRFSAKLLTQAITASFGLIAITTAIARTSPSSDFGHIRRTNYGFDEACEFKSRFFPRPECQNSKEPSILVWGDSFAMHLVPGIVSTSGTYGVVQATRSVCGPFLGIAPISRDARNGYNRGWAESCIEFNQSVLEYLTTMPSIEVIVLSSPFGQYLTPSEYFTLEHDGNEFQVDDQSANAVVSALQRTVRAVRSLGKRVVVVAPPPAGGFDIGACLERRAEAKILFGAPQDCEVRLLEYQQAKSKVLDILARLPGEADVAVFSFDHFLCSRMSCRTLIDGTFVYRDVAHFSYEGSRLVAQQVSLATQLMTLAR